MKKYHRKTLTITASLALLLLVAYVDLITTADLVLGVFYFIPISIAAWYSGRNSAIVLSVIGAIVWYVADQMTGRPYIHHYYAYWNIVLRGISFLVIALAVTQIRLMLDNERLLRGQLSLALDKVKRFAASAKRIAEGDFSAGVPLLEKDAKDHLDEAFNFMVQSLEERKSLEDRLYQLERQAIMAETASHLAHEIRNPLNLIMLTAHHVGNQFIPRERDQRKKFEELILSLKSEVEQLNRVVSGFLAIGKPSELKKAPCRISAVVDQIMILVKQQLVVKGISLERSGAIDTEIIADQEQLRLVFLNLIVNAITAVSNNGSIRFHVDHDAARKSAVVSVSDNGPGIMQEDLAKVFEPYFTRTSGGTGLGLALVKRIVEEHGGSVSAGNHPGGGAQFTLVLPMEA